MNKKKSKKHIGNHTNINNNINNTNNNDIKTDLSNLFLIKKTFNTYVRHQKKDIYIAIFCMLIVGIATSMNAWLLQPVLDDIFLQKNGKMLLIIPLIVFFNGLIKSIATFYQTSRMKIISQRIGINIQLDLYSHLIKSDISLFDKYPSGNLLSRFTNDINIFTKCFAKLLEDSICGVITFIGLMIVMFYQNLHLSIISLLIFPIAIYPVIKLGRKMRRIAKTMQEELGGFTVRLDETFQNIRIIKSYCREDYEIDRSKKIIYRLMDFYKKAAYIESASSPIMELIGGIAIAFVIWYGGSDVIIGHTTPGAFFSFIAALLMLYRPLKSLSMINNTMQEGLSIVKRLFHMLDEKSLIVDNPNQQKIKFNNYKIIFSNVSFSYDNNQKILDNMNLEIGQGETVALVGTSGVGKTTILNLLQRLYDPNNGEITMGGYNICDIRLLCLRDSIALVSQDIALFDDTIMENIRYGRLNATDEEIIEAAKASAAHEFIESFPEQYNTHIGQNGVKLSGGQRQRIAIARAILKNAPVLLLDEATSALDNISERKVQEALEYLKRGRTTIVIAHRLSTIEAADIICLIADGKILEKGTHKDLIKKKMEYYTFYTQYKNKLNVSKM